MTDLFGVLLYIKFVFVGAGLSVFKYVHMGVYGISGMAKLLDTHSSPVQ